MVLDVFRATCISNCRHKSRLQEFQSYRNISSITATVIAVSLSVSVNTQPRTAPLRVFFFCWVCYCVAISKVFQACFTTFHLKPGYVKPIKTVEEMLKSEMKFSFLDGDEMLFKDNFDSVRSEILKNSVDFPDWNMCFKWATEFQNASITSLDLHMEVFSQWVM
jgi:hypothetical protein